MTIVVRNMVQERTDHLEKPVLHEYSIGAMLSPRPRAFWRRQDEIKQMKDAEAKGTAERLVASRMAELEENLDLSNLPPLLKTPDSFVTLCQKSSQGQEPHEVPLSGWGDAFLFTSLVVSLLDDEASKETQTHLWHAPASTRHIVTLATENDAWSRKLEAIVLPGGNSFLSEGTSISSMFHIDAKGNSCFSLAEAQCATKHLIDSDFVNESQKRINTTSFHFPQQHRSVEHHLCNEQVYANFTFVEMTGLVKLI